MPKCLFFFFFFFAVRVLLCATLTAACSDRSVCPAVGLEPATSLHNHFIPPGRQVNWVIFEYCNGEIHYSSIHSISFCQEIKNLQPKTNKQKCKKFAILFKSFTLSTLTNNATLYLYGRKRHNLDYSVLRKRGLPFNIGHRPSHRKLLLSIRDREIRNIQNVGLTSRAVKYGRRLWWSGVSCVLS
jgi:hypothetical protein